MHRVTNNLTKYQTSLLQSEFLFIRVPFLRVSAVTWRLRVDEVTSPYILEGQMIITTEKEE